MKNDTFTGSDSRLPEPSSARVPGSSYEFRLFSFFKWLLHRLFTKKLSNKRTLKVKHRKRNADGSETETEIFYTEER